MLLRYIKKLDSFFWVLSATLFFVSCSVDNAKRHFLIAEKLWNEGKYAASVSEFEKAVKKDPKGELGINALHRMAITQSLFLEEHQSAIQNLRTYASLVRDDQQVINAEKEIGEILFTKLKRYNEAITHYRSLLARDISAADAPEMTYRVGKSYFYLWQFQDAINTFQEVIHNFPESTWAERSAYEIGLSYFTGGEQQFGGDENPKKESHQDVYRKAQKAFEDFLKKYPKSEWAVEAKFGMASCYEELDLLDQAIKIYEEIKSVYPSPKVIKLKMIRIQERMNKKGSRNL